MVHAGLVAPIEDDLADRLFAAVKPNCRAAAALIRMLRVGIVLGVRLGKGILAPRQDRLRPASSLMPYTLKIIGIDVDDAEVNCCTPPGS